MDTRISSQGIGSNSMNTRAAQGPQAAGTSGVDTPAVALSIQNQVARLNMVQAHASKHAATEKLGEVQEAQKEVQKLRGYVNRILRSKTEACDLSSFKDIEKDLGISLCSSQVRENDDVKAWAGCAGLGVTLGLLGALGGFFLFRHICPIYKTMCGSGEADANLRMISGVQEQATAKMQSAMTQLQDFMAQYQSFVDGARTASSKANELTMKLATSR